MLRISQLKSHLIVTLMISLIAFGSAAQQPTASPAPAPAATAPAATAPAATPAPAAPTAAPTTATTPADTGEPPQLNEAIEEELKEEPLPVFRHHARFFPLVNLGYLFTLDIAYEYALFEHFTIGLEAFLPVLGKQIFTFPSAEYDRTEIYGALLAAYYVDGAYEGWFSELGLGYSNVRLKSQPTERSSSANYFMPHLVVGYRFTTGASPWTFGAAAGAGGYFGPTLGYDYRGLPTDPIVARESSYYKERIFPRVRFDVGYQF